MNDTSDRFGLVGTIVADKYLVERVVGQGGFGVVYRANHRIWDQPVAIKCFTALSNAPVEYREELLDLFVQEGKLLSALSSKSAAIVQARDIGTLTTPGGVWLPYMVLEWLDGVALDRVIKTPENEPRGETRTIQETFTLLDGAARALALAHTYGVAHRDIKPENFFVIGGRLVPGAIVKVLDFGIAKVMQSQAGGTAMQKTGTNISSFTPNYGAPEQFDRTHGATGQWTDVFGMALVFLEVARGGAPVFDGETFLQLAFASQNPDRRPSPRALGIRASDAVEAVFQKALAVRVVDRYANLGEFWTALAGALEIRDFAPMASALSEFDDESVGFTTSGNRSALIHQTSSTVTRSQPYLAALGDQTGPHSPEVGRTIVAPQSGPHTMPMVSAPPAAPVIAAALEPPPKGRGALIAGIAAGLVGAAVVAVIALRPPTPTEPPAEKTAPSAPEKAEDPPEPVEPPAVVEAAKSPCPAGMAYVTGGKFFMGTDDDNPVLALARPAHKVEVAPYCLDLTEVTVDAYRKCSTEGECKRAFRDAFWPRGKTPKAEWEKAIAAHSALCNESYDDNGNHPINCVTWAQADEFCRFRGARLPSEAEWEFAARGSDGRVFPWGDEKPSAAHLNGCGAECLKWREAAGLDPGRALYPEDDGYAGTAPVGSFPRGVTEHGLLDMVGNLFEWTADPFAPFPSKEGVPAKSVPTNNRVIRGGAFNSAEPEHADPALRYPLDADAHSHGVGFRCAMTPPGEPAPTASG
ncbi:MAG: bifunctional serine/threonine-protein kinase/formylglycine-generating enzyme family protein [Nannocystaceae bacterium]